VRNNLILSTPYFYQLLPTSATTKFKNDIYLSPLISAREQFR
jgi:hypothetical protein